jgi:hypothetical protein
MAKKPIAYPDPKVVAAAMKRVIPLVKKFPKELQMKEAEISAAALGGAAVIHRTKSSQETGWATVFGGDLVIDGSFEIGCICIVLGDLEVRDVLTATEQQTYLVVGGSLRARGLICRGQLRVAGSVETEVAFVETSSVLAAKTIAADLVIRESDHSEVTGKVTAKKLVLNYPDPKALQQLERILHPKAFGTVDGDDDLYDFTNLEGALRRGKPWRAGARR